MIGCTQCVLKAICKFAEFTHEIHGGQGSRLVRIRSKLDEITRNTDTCVFKSFNGRNMVAKSIYL